MIVTISNRYGCGGVVVANLAAQRLGYEYVDEQLPVVVAKRLKTSPQTVESAENASGSVSERMLRALEYGTPEVRAAQMENFDRELLREVQEAVREYAAHGNVIIVGRGAHAILGARQDVLRVFLHAPRDWRVRRIAEWHAVDEKTAAAEVDRVDRARDEYLRTHYGVQFGRQDNYDLSLDTSTFGFERCAGLVEAAVRDR